MLAIRQAVRTACTTIFQKQNVAVKSVCYFSQGGLSPLVNATYRIPPLSNFARNTSLLQSSPIIRPGLLEVNRVPELSQERSVTQYSLTNGKRKTVRAVLKRFYRLDWGIWIRTKCGRHKKMYKKSSRQKRRLKEHVFCNAVQSTLLDKMVTKFWKRPKYYVDDPYTPYHKREEFPHTRKSPVGNHID